MVPSLMGWPLQVESMPDGTAITMYIGKEPTKIEAGYIYFWTTFGMQEPRAYKIVYSKSLHRKITEAAKNVPKGGKLLVDKNRKKGRGKKGKFEHEGEDPDPNKFGIRIVPPKRLLRKE